MRHLRVSKSKQREAEAASPLQVSVQNVTSLVNGSPRAAQIQCGRDWSEYHEAGSLGTCFKTS